MAKKIHELKAQEIKKISFVEVETFLKELDNTSITDTNFIDATELLDTYRLFLSIIKERIKIDDFPELNDKDKKSETMQYVNTLLERVNSFMVMSNYMRANQKVLWNDIQKTKKDITSHLKVTFDVIKKLKTNTDILNKRIETESKKLDDAEHNILTHVLTLLGVFSAIIVTIMSVVITASSWLNSGNNNDIITAFVVPVIITVIAVVTLLLLVYCLYVKPDKKYIIFIIYTILVTVVLAGMIGYCYNQNLTYEPLHVRYIIDETQYTIIKNGDSQCYEFTIDDKTYTYVCDDTFFHNNEIHYCTLHNTIE